MDKQMVAEALASLRAGFEADGADLTVDTASPERVVIRLVMTDETCADCIVPTQMLERMVSTTLRGRFPEMGQLEVVDPRTQA
jgi:Fe-S cluster biogenesis protein NfuA